MSVYREKDPTTRQEKKKRVDTSNSRKPKREDSRDKKPIISQEKPTKQAPSASLKDKGKTQADKLSSVDKTHRKRTEGGVSDHKKEDKDRRSLKETKSVVKIKKHESEKPKIKKETKTDIIYMKDILDKKAERISRRRVEEKPRIFYSEELTKRKEIDEIRPTSRRDRTRTRTLSPTEVKQLIPSRLDYELASGDQSRALYGREERLVREEKEGEEEDMKVDEEDEYEDDFEDYESDFEEDYSEASENINQAPPVELMSLLKPSAHSETEKQEDSITKSRGMDEEWKLKRQKREIDEIKKVIEKENLEIAERRKSITSPVKDDLNEENILGGKHEDPSRRQKEEVTRESFFCIRSKASQEAKEAKKRGEELLSMISLDAITYSIFEIPAIPYEEFMKVFGKSNTKQVYVQTNEDDRDEEIQTDDITLCNKWTQNPPEYLGSRKTGSESCFVLTKEERLGVGGDLPPEEDEIVMTPRTNGLWTFLSWASQIILVALERKSGNFLSLENMPNHSKAMTVGDGFVYLNAKEIPFLSGRSVTNLCLLPRHSRKLLSVHVNKKKSFQKTMICVWSFQELSRPLKILVASNRVTCCCFGPNQGNLVFAGLSDGSLCLWDLREPSIYHNQTPNNPEWTLQSPTYTTAGNMRDDEHSSSVVSVRLLSKAEEGAHGFGNFTPMQICSLDHNGTIILWSVIQIERAQKAPSEDLGLTHWGRVKLVKSSSFSIFSSLRDEIPGLYITCNDLLISGAEEDGLYVANSFGSVHHCSTYGSLMKPKFYVPAKQDAIVEATCLELCPFNDNYFLVGCGDGRIRLHSTSQEFPLICLNCTAMNEKEAAIVSLNWLPMRPCVFFALDDMSRIHVWDLGVSDMYPEISLLLTKKEITCMKLIPTSDPRQIPFIVIGAEDGSIEIHRLKKEYGSRSTSDVHNEMRMFLRYVSIL